jgi:hypothetical protein
MQSPHIGQCADGRDARILLAGRRERPSEGSRSGMVDDSDENARAARAARGSPFLTTQQAACFRISW